MEQIICMLNEINSRLDKIEIKLQNIENKQDDINKSTTLMDTHIQFVENVYDKIKQPLAYATNKISYFMNSSNNNSLTDSNLPDLID
jgi:archaellum component FlaC